METNKIKRKIEKRKKKNWLEYDEMWHDGKNGMLVESKGRLFIKANSLIKYFILGIQLHK